MILGLPRFDCCLAKEELDGRNSGRLVGHLWYGDEPHF